MWSVWPLANSGAGKFTELHSVFHEVDSKIVKCLVRHDLDRKVQLSSNLGGIAIGLWTNHAGYLLMITDLASGGQTRNT
jgi:hypothetical protein